LPEGERTLRIFLSYRRDDAAGHAGRLYDVLAERFGEESVFMDIDTIHLGADFHETIERAVSSSDVMITVIGRDWLTATDQSGRRRLDDPDDFVRLEIESALGGPVTLIPVCVEKATMPAARELPPSLGALARRQGIELRDVAWRDDVERLIREIEEMGRPGSAGAPEEHMSAATIPRWSPSHALKRVALPLVLVVAAVGGTIAALTTLLASGGGVRLVSIDGVDVAPTTFKAWLESTPRFEPGWLANYKKTELAASGVAVYVHMRFEHSATTFPGTLTLEERSGTGSAVVVERPPPIHDDFKPEDPSHDKCVCTDFFFYSPGTRAFRVRAEVFRPNRPRSEPLDERASEWYGT
jgi:hypothetical protein